jgi:hypothetical protein
MTHKCYATTRNGRRCSNRLSPRNKQFCHIHKEHDVSEQETESSNDVVQLSNPPVNWRLRNYQRDFESVTSDDISVGPLYTTGYLYLLFIILTTYIFG